MISPAAKKVHSRRRQLIYSPCTLDNLEEVVSPEEYHRGVFEKRYGYPTDIDAVWADRLKEQEK